MKKLRKAVSDWNAKAFTTNKGLNCPLDLNAKQAMQVVYGLLMNMIMMQNIWKMECVS